MKTICLIGFWVNNGIRNDTLGGVLQSVTSKFAVNVHNYGFVRKKIRQYNGGYIVKDPFFWWLNTELSVYCKDTDENFHN